MDQNEELPYQTSDYSRTCELGGQNDYDQRASINQKTVN